MDNILVMEVEQAGQVEWVKPTSAEIGAAGAFLMETLAAAPGGQMSRWEAFRAAMGQGHRWSAIKLAEKLLPLRRYSATDPDINEGKPYLMWAIKKPKKAKQPPTEEEVEAARTFLMEELGTNEYGERPYHYLASGADKAGITRRALSLAAQSLRVYVHHPTDPPINGRSSVYVTWKLREPGSRGPGDAQAPQEAQSRS